MRTLQGLHDGILKKRISQIAKYLPALGILFILTSCTSGVNRLGCVDDANTNASETWTKNSKPIRINIGIDGSGSMLGFVSTSGTRFAQAIDSLSALVAANGLSNQTSFWRLGSNNKTQKPQKITETQFLDARSPKFFCTQSGSDYPCVTSTLSQLLEIPVPSPEGRLDVLLTDLEPDSGAISILAKRYSELIKEYPDYKIVLLGIRSQFSGTVYPAQAGAFQPFTFSTAALPVDTRGRPFYVLLSGPVAAVDSFVDAFKKLPMGVSQALRASVFTSASSADDIITLDSTTSWEAPGNSACLSEINAFDRKIPSNPTQWLLGSVQSPCSSKPFEIQLISVVSNRLPTVDVPLTGFSLSPEVSGYRLSSSRISQGRLIIGLKVNPHLLNSAESVSVQANNQVLNTALWQGWDSGVTNPSGHTTQNLRLFVDSLQSISPGSAEKSAIKFCFGIQSQKVQGGSSKQPPLLIFIFMAGALLTVAIAAAIIKTRSNED